MALQLRRDRLIMTVWILGIAITALGSIAAIVHEYGTRSEQQTVLSLALANPSVLAFRGTPHGLGIGSMLWFELFSWLAVVVGLMNVFFATRHGRADEERGRRELVGATPIGRAVPLASTLVLGVVANVVLGLLLAGAFATAKGVDGAGALAAGATFAVTGLAFLGVSLLVGEVAPTSRSANSIGVTIVVAAYVLRAAGDSVGVAHLRTLTLDTGWPSWISPIGWSEQVLPMSANQLALLLPGIALALLTATLAFAVHARRDLGASLLPERVGRATGSMRGVFGLAARLHRPALVGWAVGGAVMGIATGSLARAVGDLSTTGTPQILETLKLIVPGGRGQVLELFVGTLMLLVALLATAAGIQGALRLRQDEAEGRAELLLAAPVSRPRLMLASVATALVASIVVMLAAGVAAWLSLLAEAGEAGIHAFGQALAELPAVLAFPGIAAVAVAVLPRAAVAVAWAAFAVGVMLGLFGQLLQLPKDLIRISPFDHIPSVPFDDWRPTVVLLAVDVALAAAAVALIRRRDLST
jgi:ABC-2 type transport system permease protein